MKLGEKIKFIKKGKEIYNTFKSVKESKDKIAGMSLWEFMQKIRTNPEQTLRNMSKEEIYEIFDKENSKKLYKVMPKLEGYVKAELESRGLSENGD